jgi:hypothetical protein
VEHRLKHVGWNGDPAFDDETYAAIFSETGGIPRRINQLCNRLLLSGFLGEKHALTASDVEQVGSEIRDELGGSSLGPSPSPVPSAAALYEESQRADNVIRPFSLSAITARLDRLERSVNTLIELIRAQSGPLPERRGRSTRQAKSN